MGFSDEDFDNAAREFPGKPGKRNATLYKLAGNSIVVQVLEAIFEVILNPAAEFGSYYTEADGQLALA